jgi:hypothetical protein
MAVDSVIKRQQSLLDLMRHTDIRSQQLTVAYAGFMGAGLLFVARDPALAASSKLAAATMIGYAVSLTVGAGFGFFAAWYAKIGLASRSGDFWLWALDPQNASRAIPEFLRNAEDQIVQNEAIQIRAAKLLKAAMACGLIAVFTASLGFLLPVAQGLCSR